VWEGKPTDEKVEVNGEVTIQKSESELLKESNLAEKDGEEPKVAENGSISKTGEAPKGAKPVVSEGKVALGSNGIANGC